MQPASVDLCSRVPARTSVTARECPMHDLKDLPMSIADISEERMGGPREHEATVRLRDDLTAVITLQVVAAK